MFCKWISGIFLLLSLGAFAQPDYQESVTSNCKDLRKSFSYREIIQSVCQIVNDRRVGAGQSPLILDPDLSNVAQAYAEDMVRRNYFSHTNPEGQIAGIRLQLAGIDWSTWGENIATYHSTPSAVMKAWMNSSGHRKNILSSKYGKIGIGYYQNYWVQVFTD